MSNPISFTHNSCISNVSFIHLHTFSLILNASPSQLFYNAIILFSLTPTAYLSSFTFSCCIFIGSPQNTLSCSTSSLSFHPLRSTPWGETISSCGHSRKITDITQSPKPSSWIFWDWWLVFEGLIFWG